MTKAAEAPWAQLGITEEEFNERQAKVNALANGSGSAHGANPSDAPAITRRKRSDAGTKRGPKRGPKAKIRSRPFQKSKTKKPWPKRGFANAR